MKWRLCARFRRDKKKKKSDPFFFVVVTRKHQAHTSIATSIPCRGCSQQQPISKRFRFWLLITPTEQSSTEIAEVTARTTKTVVESKAEKPKDRDCWSSDGFVRPEKLSHGISDDELFWRASMVWRSHILTVPKVAFMLGHCRCFR